MQAIEMKTLQSKYANESSTMQLTHLESLTHLKARFTDEIQTLHSTHDATNTLNNTKIKHLEMTMLALQTENSTLTSELKESRREADALSVELTHVKTTLDTETANRRHAEDACRNWEREVLQLTSKYDGVMQQLRDKEELVQQMQQLCRSAEEAKSLCEDKLETYSSTLEIYRDKLEQSGQEIDKGNVVMSRLGNENKLLKERMQMKSEVLRRQVHHRHPLHALLNMIIMMMSPMQELAVTELRGKMSDVEKHLSESNVVIRSLEGSNQQLHHEIDLLSKKLKESAEVIQSNQSVIVYLNQLVNNEQLGGYAAVVPQSFKPDSTTYVATTRPHEQTRRPDAPLTRTKSHIISNSPDSVRGLESPPAMTSHTHKVTPNMNDDDVYLQGLRYLGLGDSPSKLKVVRNYWHFTDGFIYFIFLSRSWEWTTPKTLLTLSITVLLSPLRAKFIRTAQCAIHGRLLSTA
jgi:chromosome segregation ATPase